MKPSKKKFIDTVLELNESCNEAIEDQLNKLTIYLECTTNKDLDAEKLETLVTATQDRLDQYHSMMWGYLQEFKIESSIIK